MEMVKKTIWCDVCETEINKAEDLGANESRMMSIVNISVDAWYQGVFSPTHICVDCQNSILDHMKKISGKQFLAKGWIKK